MRNELNTRKEIEEYIISTLMNRGEKQPSGLVTVTRRQIVNLEKKTGFYGIERIDSPAGVVSAIIEGHQYAVQQREGYDE